MATDNKNQNENQYTGIISNYKDKTSDNNDTELHLDAGFDDQIEAPENTPQTDTAAAPVQEPQVDSQPEIPVESVPQTPVEAPITESESAFANPPVESPVVSESVSPVVDTAPITPPPVNNLEQIILNGRPPESLEDNSAPVVSSEEMKPKHSVFRLFFLLSLFIFLGVSAAVAVYLVKSNIVSVPKKLIPSAPTPASENSDSTTTNNSCHLNDKTYKISESFAAADGCNTCTCNADQTISCTEKVCAVPTVVTPVSTSSAIAPVSTKSATPTVTIKPTIKPTSTATKSSVRPTEVIENVKLN